MEISMIIDPDVFEQAKIAARQAQPLSSIEGLHAPMNAALQGRIDEAWSTIESAITKGFLLGKEKVHENFQNVLQKVDAIINDAGARSLMVRQALLQRLQVFNQKYVQGALERCPNQVVISGTDYKLNKLSFTQKLALSGSLAISLEKVFEMVSEGEIEISAEYVLPK